MSALHIFVLALIQGITEFLPISSSGHLILLPVLTSWPDQGPLIDVSVHVGTLIAVLIYFRRDTAGLVCAAGGAVGLKGLKRSAEASGHYRLFWALVLATIPVVAVGLAFSVLGVVAHLRSPAIIASTSIIFGLLLWWADTRFSAEKDMADMKLKPALIIGLMQILSLIPGTSRSGVTITAGRMLGFNRPDAARFSMLLSIPTILGAGLLTAKDLIVQPDSAFIQTALVGVMLSCISALAAIHLFMKWLSKASMTPFVIYRVLLGVGLFALIGSGWLAA